jgi:hypothetical protein
MHRQEEEDNDGQFLVNNLDEVKDYMDFLCDIYSKSYSVDIDTLQADVVAFQSNESTLLLDSCSTLNLLMDSALLDDIHEVDKTMHARCNAGTMKMNLMGQFGDFPEPVWYNPDGVANILLLYIVSQHYWVTMDTKHDNVMYVTKNDGTVLRFMPVGKGLYAYTGNDACK